MLPARTCRPTTKQKTVPVKAAATVADGFVSSSVMRRNMGVCSINENTNCHLRHTRTHRSNPSSRSAPVKAAAPFAGRFVSASERRRNIGV